MRRKDLRLLVDVLLLVAAFLTFASGLVLLLRFHMGEGAFRASALGHTRLAWLNLHRLPAVGVAAGAGLHVALNWRAFVAQLRRTFAPGRHSRGLSEPLLYVSFWLVALLGLGLWLLVAGGAPLRGPVALERLPNPRHFVVDVHHIGGLVALALAAHHVGHRWHGIIRGLAAWARRPATAATEGRVCDAPEP